MADSPVTTYLTKGARYDTARLQFSHWQDKDGAICTDTALTDGRNVWYYFENDGTYRGAPHDGIEPIFFTQSLSDPKPAGPTAAEVAAVAAVIRTELESALTAQAISQAAATLGRKGGQTVTEKKAAAVRENGKKGGRPRLCQCGHPRSAHIMDNWNYRPCLHAGCKCEAYTPRG